MEREPTPTEKVLAGLVAAVCTMAVVGVLTFGVAAGLTQLHPKLGIAWFALCLCILLFQNHFARRPWLKALTEKLESIFQRAIVARGR